MMILVNLFALLTAALFFFKKISPLAFMTSSLLWFLMMLMFWFIMPRIVYRKSSIFRESLKVSMDEQVFELINQKTSRSWEWNSFSFWMETPHFFHLYFNPRSFLIIPKDAFSGDDDVKAREYFKQNIGKKSS